MKKELVITKFEDLMFRDFENYVGKKDVVFALKRAFEDAMDAALLETTGAGLAEIRQAKEEIKTSLRFSSIRDLFDGGGANASAKALSLRADSGTATIATIDKTGARALEEQLCFAAAWLGRVAINA